MATIYDNIHDEPISVNANSSAEIAFTTSKLSIPAINYSNDTEERSYSNGGGLKGIAISLYMYHFNYVYGNRNAIILPTETGSSVSGRLELIFTSGGI